MNYDINPMDFKACHPLGKFTIDSNKKVIVKFIYFHHKNELYSRRSMLANKMNGKPIFVSERLSKHDNEVRKYDESLGLIITTRNCEVRVFRKEENDATQTYPVHSV